MTDSGVVASAAQAIHHVYIIANPVGGGGKVPALVRPLLALLAKRFTDFKPKPLNAKDDTIELVNVSTGTEGEARKQTCSAHFTEESGDGIRIASEIAKKVAQLPPAEIARTFIIPVGGDGTLSEVVHGLSTTILNELGLPASSLPNIVYLAAGTGADFARLGLCCKSAAEVMHVIDASTFVDPTKERGDIDVAACGARRVDVGSVTRLQSNEVRYFINEASVGLSNAVVVRAESMKKSWISCFGGGAVFLAASAYELFKMSPHCFRMRKLPVQSGMSSPSDSIAATDGTSRVAIPMEHPLAIKDSKCPQPAEVQRKHWDQGDWVYLDSTALVFGNGQFFGGGMKICPHGDPCDQALAVASWGETIFGYATGVFSVYNGNATTKWKTSRMLSASRILVELAPNKDASSPVPAEIPAHAFMETDGEPMGALPAIIEVSHQLTFLLPLQKEVAKGSRKTN